MGLEKAIKHNKEYRKPWKGTRYPSSIDKTCRNNNYCPICRRNRLHSTLRNIQKAQQNLKDYLNLD